MGAVKGAEHQHDYVIVIEGGYEIGRRTNAAQWHHRPQRHGGRLVERVPAGALVAAQQDRRALARSHLALGNEELQGPPGVAVDTDRTAIRWRAMIGRDREGRVAAVPVGPVS
jgi:hypothetical protein